MEAMTLTLWTLTLWTLTLSLTYAMRLAGWFGLPVLLFFSMLTCYTAKLLGKILEHVPSKKLRDGAGAYTIYGFHDMGELVFGEYGKILISVIFVLETFGYCCVYLIIEGENLEHQLRYHPWFQGWGKAEFMSMSALIFLPSCLLRNLSWLSYFSALGVFSSMCLLIGVLATGLLPDTPPAPGLSQSRPLPEF
jgi:vesicular inhibitory amino acid transporter